MTVLGGTDETAEVLHLSPDPVKRDWRFAKLWLARELGGLKAKAPVKQP